MVMLGLMQTTRLTTGTEQALVQQGVAGESGGIDDSIHTLLSQQSLWEHRRTWQEAEKYDRYCVQHLTHSNIQLQRVGSKAGPSSGNQLSGEDMTLRVLKGTAIH